MNSQKTLYLLVMLLSGLLMFSFSWTEGAYGYDQDQTRDRLKLHVEDCDCTCTCCQDCPCPCCENCPCPCCQDNLIEVESSSDQEQIQDHIQDRLQGGDCDCLCTCCQGCLCTCNNNCLCPCCQDDFCTSRENRLLINIDQTFRENIVNRFRIQDRYMIMGKRDAESETETSGNCLSYPVIFVDGPVPLRGEYGNPVYDGEFRLEDPGDPLSVRWYLQQDEFNAWQAKSHQWGTGQGEVLLEISDLVWGDNLYARDWTTHSVVRVETVLYADYGPMDEFEMKFLFGEGPEEMQGTNGEIFDSWSPTVFTPQAYLSIQRWLPESDELTWNDDAKLWEGAETPIVRGGYTAEINVKGKVIFGYNWFVQYTAEGPGLYRITMWLDETSEALIGQDDGHPYVDVGITDAAAGGGGGGGGNGGNGGSTLVADFEAIPTSGEAPLLVYFNDNSTGNPTSWYWKFGEGYATSTEQNPTYYYQNPGTFTVALTIEKGMQNDREVKVGYITVTGDQPETGTTMHIETIDMDYSKKGQMHDVDTTVELRDENDNAISGASVELMTTFPDSSTKTKSLNTSEDGTVTFHVSSRLDGEYISEVIDVSHSSHVYAPAGNNVDTICSLVLP